MRRSGVAGAVALTTAHINTIATAVPPHDIHAAYLGFARTLFDDPRAKLLFDRMAAKAQIEHRFSVLPGAADPTGNALDANRVYTRDAFPSTAQRMRLYEKHAPDLALEAVRKLAGTVELSSISHVVCMPRASTWTWWSAVACAPASSARSSASWAAMPRSMG
jgi:predicted naringenin-chalcone synthase